MKNSTLIKNVNIVNERQIKIADVFIQNGIIEYIGIRRKKQLMMH
jgi:dihydroorotase-like cyclic amidohydrolase